MSLSLLTRARKHIMTFAILSKLERFATPNNKPFNNTTCVKTPVELTNCVYSQRYYPFQSRYSDNYNHKRAAAHNRL